MIFLTRLFLQRLSWPLAAALQAAALAFLPACSFIDQLASQENAAVTGASYQQQVPSAQPPASSEPASTPWGIVQCLPGMNYKAFNLQVRQFLSTSSNPNVLPGIHCAANSEGGVLFKGSVTFAEGVVFNPRGGSTGSVGGALYVSSNSFIEIHVVDGHKKPAIKQPIKLAAAPFAGEISSNGAAILHFQDKHGEITLEGRVDSKHFSGHFRYKNYSNWQGGSGYAGTLGQFNIEACQFFTCQEAAAGP